MKQVLEAALHAVSSGEPAALVTVVSTTGSTPQKAGAKMVVLPDGTLIGTIGGGCGEADVIRAALDVIQTGEPQVVHVDLTEDISMQSLGVCGGIMNVFVERWTPEPA